MQIKIILSLIVLSISLETSANSSMIFWSGCVQGKVKEQGKSKGVHGNFCKELTEKEKSSIPVAQNNDSIEEEVETLRHVFYLGCSKGGTKESICHELTKEYYKTTWEIINQNPESVKK